MKLKNLKTSYLGRNLIFYEIINSTQKQIKAFENPMNGTLVIADNQVSGVGTHDRKWFTGTSKNIAMSFVLLPNCNLQKIQNLTVCIAECMIKAMKTLYGIQLDRKEPNDIYYQGKKVGGILTESVCQGEQVQRIYVGIGLNVNQEAFPIELQKIATSLKIEFKRDFEKEEIIAEFLNQFEKEFEYNLSV